MAVWRRNAPSLSDACSPSPDSPATPQPRAPESDRRREERGAGGKRAFGRTEWPRCHGAAGQRLFAKRCAGIRKPGSGRQPGCGSDRLLSALKFRTCQQEDRLALRGRAPRTDLDMLGGDRLRACSVCSTATRSLLASRSLLNGVYRSGVRPRFAIGARFGRGTRQGRMLATFLTSLCQSCTLTIHAQRQYVVRY